MTSSSPCRPETLVEREGSESPVLFDAVLAPNRSLGRAGFIAVMAGVIVISIGLGVFFLLQGAWPVLGFFGLDIALLYIAFRLSYRSGRLRETIRVSADEVVVRRIAPNGRTMEWRFNPYWLRVALDDPVEHHSQITLTTHGRSLVIGPFLAPEERATLVQALRDALGEANRRYAGAPLEEQEIEASEAATRRS
ncbi:MAG: DUF2244 domain-containing protein [Rhodospirillales bacterium]|nr:DUF2244 domain-containing protein [Rhodospirillales bacterium]